MSQALSALRSDTDGELLQVKGTRDGISNDLHERIYNNVYWLQVGRHPVAVVTHIVDTRKEIDSISVEGNAKSKSLVEEMHKYKHR